VRTLFTVLAWIGLLLLVACLDEWFVWRRNRCARRAMERARERAEFVELGSRWRP